MNRSTLPRVLAAALLALFAPEIGSARTPSREQVVSALDSGSVERVRALGQEALPVLAELYRAGDRERRVAIARTWYALGWRSEDAKRALLEDLETQNAELRLEVQWALGRVSADPMVVRRLLETMRGDPNPLFRDKAACALASDQIHLDPEQRLAELTGLVDALDDDTPQVRRIALQALRILTGQTKDFRPDAPPSERARAVERWRRWLDDYRSSL